MLCWCVYFNGGVVGVDYVWEVVIVVVYVVLVVGVVVFDVEEVEVVLSLLIGDVVVWLVLCWWVWNC